MEIFTSWEVGEVVDIVLEQVALRLDQSDWSDAPLCSQSLSNFMFSRFFIK